MALIEGVILAAASPATVVIEFLFEGWPPLVLQPLPAATSTDLDDDYPILDSIDPLDLVSADSKGNPGDLIGPPNRVAIFGKQRSDTLKNYTNSMIRLANLLTDNFLDRDGEQVGLLISETTYMRAALDLGGFKLINMAPAILAKDLVNFDQFKDVQFSFDDQEDIKNSTILRRDGTNVMASQFDLGITTPGRRLINLAAPALVGHAVTKTYNDVQLDNFETGNLLRTGVAPMLGDWDLGVFGLQFTQDPTADSDGSTKGWFDALALSAGGNGVPVGTITPHFGTTIPSTEFLLCDGREVARVDHPLLFSVIGVAYGTPTSGLLFKLPDLRGRVVIGQDNMGGVQAGVVTTLAALILGGTLGLEEHQLFSSEIPAHAHGITDNYFSAGSTGGLTGMDPVVADANTLVTVGSSVAAAGSDTAHPNVQPSMACVYLIRTG